MRKPILLLLLVALLTGCENSETVEQEAFGMTERFEVDKKTGQKNGTFEKFDANGTLYEKSEYRTDKLEGERTIYHDDGNPEIIETYNNGVMDGPFKTFYTGNRKELEGQYVDGVMTGIWKRYYKDGQLMEEVTFENNEENGPFTEYHKNGNLKAEGQYKGGGREHGLLKLYDENGELYKRMECNDGICQTTWTRPGYQPDEDE